MPRTKTKQTGRLLFRLLFFSSLVGWVLVALGRERRAEPEPEAAPSPRPQIPSIPRPRESRVKLDRWEAGKGPAGPRRVALATMFTALFFAGAALTAGAGDQSAKLLEETLTEAAASAPSDSAQPAETTAAQPEAQPESAPEAAPQAEPTESAPAAEPTESAPAADPAASDDSSPEGTDTSAPSAQPETAPAPSDAASAQPQSSTDDVAPATEGSTRPHLRNAPAKHPARRGHPRRAARAAARKAQAEVEARANAKLDPEATLPGVGSIVWLHRVLPDPTPPASRLSRAFVHRLVRTSRQAGTNWAMVLAVLRANGDRSSNPATTAQLHRIASRVATAHTGHDQWNTMLTLQGHTAWADQATALARYYRAVGTETLVRGLEAQKQRLTEKLLNDKRVDIYAGGRQDLLLDRVDVRVIVLIRYLAEAYGQVTVSCLVSGHRLYARPGVVSAHIYGLAVDISALGGRAIAGNQEPGGLTEHAVRDILLLPREVQARQVISLLGLGGASFPLANHWDHIHVGF
jgi:hypothetical protein